ncbi:MAG: LysM peptidoglycan-binding domain-containing protein [Verrucomicrobiae bacterium]|nr:LysM peptidoglycan-binding domain-containing protein [Verrucomicrobiae bacterium]
MKRVLRLTIAAVLGCGLHLYGQDAATEERLNKLQGQVEDLFAAQRAQREQIAELARELAALNARHANAQTQFVTREELRLLAEKIQELDRKREADKELILREIEKLGKTLSAPSRAANVPAVDATQLSPDQKGYEYVIQPGDTLSAIAEAYRQRNIKVTVEQILAANPGLDPKRLKVGQKIFIPAPSR